jgi:RimJ/RimL family protein N-acetyltransferase
VEIVLHGDAGTFAAAAGPLLRADPLRHTVALTVLDGMCRAGDPFTVLLTGHEGGRVVAGALRSPGRYALVSAVPPAYAAGVEVALAEADPEVPGVIGPTAEAEAIAAAYTARTGHPVTLRVRTRLFALARLDPPCGIPGAPRLADESDLDLLARWREAIAEELAHFFPAGSLSQREIVARSLRLGAGEMLWEVDGEPVAQARAQPLIAGMSRIGPVYTPPEHRGRGYAAAVTAAASRWALDAGAERVLLFTDLANPTTNRLYPRIGYRPVHDAVELEFRA